MNRTWPLADRIGKGGSLLLVSLVLATGAIAQEPADEDPCAVLPDLTTRLTAGEDAAAILTEIQALHPTCQLTAEAQSMLARAAQKVDDPRLAAEGINALERLQLPGTAGPVTGVESWLATRADAALAEAKKARSAGDPTKGAVLALEAVALEPDLLSRADEHLSWMLGWIETNEAAWSATGGLDLFRRGEAAYLVGDLERAISLLKKARATGLDGGRRLKVSRYLELIEAEHARAEKERAETAEEEREEDAARARREEAEEHQKRLKEVEERTREDLEARFRDERRRVEIDQEVKEIEGRLAELAGKGAYEAIPTLDGKVVLVPQDFNKIWNEQRQLEKRRRELDRERSNLR